MQRTNRFSAVRLGAVLLALFAMVSFAHVPGASAQNESVTIDLKELNSSGVSGTATLTDNGDGTTTVSIQVEGSAGDHPTHIHEGTCDDLNPNPQYPLNDIDKDGKSETTIDVSLADLLGTPHAVNAHESATNLGTYVACGVIVRAKPATESTAEASPTGVGSGATTPPATGIGSTSSNNVNLILLAGVGIAALALFAGGYGMRKRDELS